MLETHAFEPEFIHRLDNLILGIKRARTIRAGRRSVGRTQGGGVEVENFREYTEGDDLRFLDWNAFARLDHLAIRTFRADRQVETTVMIDASASMALPERDDKLGLALLLGAGLAYIAMSENDPVRLVSFAGHRGTRMLETTTFHRRRESYPGFRPFVTGIRCGGETRLAAAVGELLLERRQPGIFILISDFLVNAGDYEDALTQLLMARHEVKALHVMGDREAAGNYPPGAYRARDCETGEMREVMFGAREALACRKRVELHADQLRDFCTRRGIVYARAFGASQLDAIVAQEFPRLGVIA
jgi:Mg-chelatase subunit ChlD